VSRLIEERAVVTKVSSIKDTLKKRGYSEKAIEEILVWYGLSTRKSPRNT
jgi:hypothetical protein